MKQTIKDMWPDRDMFLLHLDEAKYGFIDDDWFEDGEYDDELEWYVDYGRGEAEGQLMEELLEAIRKALGEQDFDFYFHDKYGEVNLLIYEIYPELEN